MEDKLVTLAIHSFEKAQILKTILENNDIEVYIHNVNLIQPVVSAGVRVRIKESDLPAALKIIENMKFSLEEDETKEVSNSKMVLVPIDFSEYSLQACKFAFHYAQFIKGEVILLHAYFSPFFSNPLPVGDLIGYSASEELAMKDVLSQVNKDMGNFKNIIQRMMEKGDIPYVKFDTVIREGVPEEEIIRYSREFAPALIIMGTRGKHQKDLDLIGSVTAEVIDRTRVPLFAFPDRTHLDKLEDIKNIAFVTNFEQRDLVSFEYIVKFLDVKQLNVHFIYLSPSKENTWNEIKLAGIKEYFTKQYANITITYKVVKGENVLEKLDEYIQIEKIDAIALTNKRRNVFARLFNPSMARRMLFHNDTPLIIFP